MSTSAHSETPNCLLQNPNAVSPATDSNEFPADGDGYGEVRPRFDAGENQDVRVLHFRGYDQMD